MKISFIAVCLSAAVAFVVAQEPVGETNQKQVERGQKQFVQTCAFCHGPDATGGRAPDLVRSQLVNEDTTGAQIAQVIKNGRIDKGMPAFAQLNDSQIADIIAFLRDRIKNQSKYPGQDYPLERLLVGNAEAGQAFFNGAGGCARCHSPTGDLAHIASRHPPVDLQQQMLMPESGRARKVTVHANGETITGELTAIDEFHIALRDSNGWHHSFPRDQVTFEITDPVAAHRELLWKITDSEMHNLFAYLATLK